MYFHVCIFWLDTSVLVKIKFLLQSIMVCTPKHTLTHRGNTGQVMTAEVTTLKPDTHQVQSAEDMFSTHLFMFACYFLVLITTMTSFPMMHEKDTSCPAAIRLQPHTTLHDMGFQRGKEIHSENQKLCIHVKPLSVSSIYIRIGVLHSIYFHGSANVLQPVIYVEITSG